MDLHPQASWSSPLALDMHPSAGQYFRLASNPWFPFLPLAALLLTGLHHSNWLHKDLWEGQMRVNNLTLCYQETCNLVRIQMKTPQIHLLVSVRDPEERIQYSLASTYSHKPFKSIIMSFVCITSWNNKDHMFKFSVENRRTTFVFLFELSTCPQETIMFNRSRVIWEGLLPMGNPFFTLRSIQWKERNNPRWYKPDGISFNFICLYFRYSLY